MQIDKLTVTRFLRTVQNQVCGGLVLDDAGQWTPLEQALDKERRILAHLEAGEVIHGDGDRWIPIEAALSGDGRTTPLSPPDDPSAFDSLRSGLE